MATNAGAVENSDPNIIRISMETEKAISAL